MVAHAFPHATRVLLSQRVRPLVLEPTQSNGRGQHRVQRTNHQTLAQSPASVHFASAEERRGEADAEKVRACRAVSVEQASTLLVRRVHVVGVDARETSAGQLHLGDKHTHAVAQSVQSSGFVRDSADCVVVCVRAARLRVPVDGVQLERACLREIRREFALLSVRDVASRFRFDLFRVRLFPLETIANAETTHRRDHDPTRAAHDTIEFHIELVL